MTSCPHSGLGSLTSSEARKAPVQFLTRLQSECPVYVDPVTGFYVVTKYNDIGYISDNPGIFSSQIEILIGRSGSPVAGEVRRRLQENGFPEVHTLNTADPPHHTRFRSLVDKVFTPSYVKSLDPLIHKTVDELIDTFVANGKVELAWEFAYLLPLYMIADQLGLPREDWRKIRHWSDVSVARADPALAPERELELTDEFIEMQQYIVSFVRKFRADPEDNLLSRLANVQEDGVGFTEGELVSVGAQLMVAGNETTATTIISVMNELLLDPALLDQVTKEKSLVMNIVEEVLRLHSPVPNFMRVSKQDATVGGIHIPADSTVVLSYMAANYDPAKFENPGKLDINRKGARGHLSFGRGVHYCIGHILAKTEIRIAIEHLLSRLSNMRLDSDRPVPSYMEHAFIHAIDAVYMKFDPAVADGWA